MGIDKCCRHLKTGALLEAIRRRGFDAAFGGARREEEKSRAKERVISLRDVHGQWDPKRQRPEPWDLYNTSVGEGESARVFPLSNWTERDIWEYIRLENIPVVPIYFARERDVVIRNGILIPVADCSAAGRNSRIDVSDETVSRVMCRFRSLGCIPCTGAVASTAASIDEIIAELRAAKKSERENRVIDMTGESSMEQKKREGYF
jgi:sulfate adenylyltransferase subunit 2